LTLASYQLQAPLTDPPFTYTTLFRSSVIVDNTAPTAGTLSFSGLSDSGSLDSPTPITTDGTFNLNLAGDLDANGVSVAYEVSTDGGTTWTATTATQTSLPDASYQIGRASCRERGYSSATSAISVIVDNTQPTACTRSSVHTTSSRNWSSDTATTDLGTFNLNLAGDLDANGVSVAYEVSTDGGTTWTATTATQTSLPDASY